MIRASLIAAVLLTANVALAQTVRIGVDEAADQRVIQTRDGEVRVPLHPRRTTHPTPYLDRAFGVALDGIPFDPGPAVHWNNDPASGWTRAVAEGVPPYRGLPDGMLSRLPWRKQPTLLGYAADGFPIYASHGWQDPMKADSGAVELRSSWRLKTGQRNGGPGGPHDGTYVQDYEFVGGSGDLDPCNGRTGVTPEFPQGTYHYVLTAQYPFIPRCFMARPGAALPRG